MSMQHGKLTLEAIEGTHGDIAQRIALELVEALEQRAELLEALKVVLPIAIKSNRLSVQDYNKAAQAIIRAEAAE